MQFHTAYLLFFLLMLTGCQPSSLKYPENKKTDDTGTVAAEPEHEVFNFTFEGNPLVRHISATDPDAHVWDDTLWVYCSQDHHSIVEFKGRWYYFYHYAGHPFTPSGWKGSRRILCFDELEYEEDGTIRMVKQTRQTL